MPKLKKFNEALVDHYCPERALYGQVNPQAWFGIREFIHAYKQKKDFKKALVHAEDKVLLFIENPNLRSKLKGKHIEQWIKQWHKLAGKSLLKGWGVASGAYIKQIVVRWEKTTEFGIAFGYILNNAHEKNRRDELLCNLFRDAELQVGLKDWLGLIDKAQRKQFKVPSEYLPSHLKVSEKVMFSIAYARHHGLLSENEQAAVDKVCKFVMPDLIESKMKSLTSRLAGQFIECDGQLDNVVHLAATAFRDLTQIHPFPNANGRVSTILLNTILVGFGFPSIVLRTHEDRMDEKSQYNQVVANMDSDLLPLETFIKAKVIKNQLTPQNGTVESTPAKDDADYLLSDAIFDMIKGFKKKYDKETIMPRGVTLEAFTQAKPPQQLNQCFKEELMAIGKQRFGFDMMYFPGYIEYTQEEMLTINAATMKL